ncbi:MAG: sulfite exporter TauE/SafE family protein [Clostridia bacterium]|nr:sulfite exporter TauE/SafE family protein [Clostridia bacterium]
MNKSSLKRVFAGLLTGVVNGLFGGGGGMVVVPLMKNMLGYEEKYAHATAILVIAPVCAASLVTYLVNGYFSAEVILPAAIGSVAGGLVGAELLDKLPEFWVNAVFLAVMLAAGIRMLF